MGRESGAFCGSRLLQLVVVLLAEVIPRRIRCNISSGASHETVVASLAVRPMRKIKTTGRISDR